LEDDQSLKIKWRKFEGLPFTVHVKKPGILSESEPDTYEYRSAQNSVEMFGI
jgi:hypothetical protein